tara:strand:- start:75 stop:254 length:180 start_codon:yes stop_codon:yes gene_type:complete
MLVVVAEVDKDQQDQVELVAVETLVQVVAHKLEQLIQVVEEVVNLVVVIQDLKMQVVQV